jgi:hypothetical protein
MPLSTWSHDSGNAPPTRARDLALLTGLVGPPFMWLLTFELTYALSYAACISIWWPLHASVLLGIAGALASGSFAWQAGGRSSGWTHWMAIAGVAMSIWFAIVILSLEFPLLSLPPCRP